MDVWKISKMLKKILSRKKTIKYYFNYFPFKESFENSPFKKLDRAIKNKSIYYKILQEQAKKISLNSTLEVKTMITQFHLNVEIDICGNCETQTNKPKPIFSINGPQINKSLAKILCFKRNGDYETRRISFSYTFDENDYAKRDFRNFDNKYTEFLKSIVDSNKLCNLVFISNPLIEQLKEKNGFEKLNLFYKNIEKLKQACIESGLSENSISYQVISDSFIFLTNDDFFWTPLSIDFELHKKMFSSDNIGIEFISKVFLSRIYKKLDTSELTEENYKEYFVLGKMMSY